MFYNDFTPIFWLKRHPFAADGIVLRCTLHPRRDQTHGYPPSRGGGTRASRLTPGYHAWQT